MKYKDLNPKKPNRCDFSKCYFWLLTLCSINVLIEWAVWQFSSNIHLSKVVRTNFLCWADWLIDWILDITLTMFKMKFGTLLMILLSAMHTPTAADQCSICHFDVIVAATSCKELKEDLAAWKTCMDSRVSSYICREVCMCWVLCQPGVRDECDLCRAPDPPTCPSDTSHYVGECTEECSGPMPTINEADRCINCLQSTVRRDNLQRP